METANAVARLIPLLLILPSTTSPATVAYFPAIPNYVEGLENGAAERTQSEEEQCYDYLNCGSAWVIAIEKRV